MAYQNIDKILDYMDRFGGGFVTQLAKLYRQADVENKLKCEITFKKYFDQYNKMMINNSNI